MNFFLIDALIPSNIASMSTNMFFDDKNTYIIHENVCYKVLKQLNFYTSITSAN